MYPAGTYLPDWRHPVGGKDPRRPFMKGRSRHILESFTGNNLDVVIWTVMASYCASIVTPEKRASEDITAVGPGKRASKDVAPVCVWSI